MQSNGDSTRARIRRAEELERLHKEEVMLTVRLARLKREVESVAAQLKVVSSRIDNMTRADVRA